MSEILSQEEVDALLNNQFNQDTETPAPGILSEDDSEVKNYNLATQGRVVRNRMPTLEMINERFAKSLRIGLFNLLRKNIEITANRVQTSKLSDFTRTMVVPTNINIIAIKPLRGNAMIAMNPQLVFSIVENMFGGNGKFHTRIEGRDFTQTEQRVIKRVIDAIFEALKTAWNPVIDVEFEFVSSEMNPKFASIATPNEVIVYTTFNVEIGTLTSEFHLCMPYTMIEPVREILSSTMQMSDTTEQDSQWASKLKRQIQSTEVELSADLGHGTLEVGKLLHLKPGDVLMMDAPKLVEAKVDGIPIMECTYGKLNKQIAIKIVKFIDHNAQD